jgi:hypothetical protein
VESAVDAGAHSAQQLLAALFALPSHQGAQRVTTCEQCLVNVTAACIGCTHCSNDIIGMGDMKYVFNIDTCLYQCTLWM